MSIRPGLSAPDVAETNGQANTFQAGAAEPELTAANKSSSAKSELGKPASEAAKPEGEAVQPAGGNPPPASEAPATVPQAAPPAGPAPKVQYDLNQLPKPIKRMLEHIVVAAQSGDIGEMLPVLEENELPPMLSTSKRQAIRSPSGRKRRPMVRAATCSPPC